MKLVFFGPPGAGKGTIAARARVKFSVPHISTGDTFREEIRKKSQLGLKVKSIIDSGGLVPDETTIRIVKERLTRPDARGGFILDGFPRTIAQARALSEQVEIDHVINFICPENVLIKRLTGRLQCPECKAIYNTATLGEAKDCPRDHTRLIVRDDDKIESVKQRLQVYADTSAEVIEWYKKENKLHELDSNQSSDNVLEAMSAFLSSLA